MSCSCAPQSRPVQGMLMMLREGDSFGRCVCFRVFGSNKAHVEEEWRYYLFCRLYASHGGSTEL